MTTYYIYGLIDPTTKEVRYVGCSKTPVLRFSQHLTYGRHQDYKKCTGEWICELLRKGQRPELIIFEEYETKWKSYALDAEKQWMHHHIASGARLLNKHTASHYKRTSRILPDREPTVARSDERGWYYTFDY